MADYEEKTVTDSRGKLKPKDDVEIEIGDTKMNEKPKIRGLWSREFLFRCHEEPRLKFLRPS